MSVPPAPAFKIDLRFGRGLNARQRDAFSVAAARWSRIIVGDVPAVVVDGATIDDVVIDAEAVAIDGPGQVLGQSGPTQLRPRTFLPAAGIMSFDTADMAQMQADGSLVNVIVHEMGHVLGIGSIWEQLGLSRGAGGANPVFTGTNASREFGSLLGGGPRAVPLANTGGPGTRDVHWRESVFANELMTGFLDPGPNPISRVTIGALQDVGYEVDYAAADRYALPGSRERAIMGVGADVEDHGGHGIILVPEPTVLPDSALIDRG